MCVGFKERSVMIALTGCEPAQPPEEFVLSLWSCSRLSVWNPRALSPCGRLGARWGCSRRKGQAWGCPQPPKHVPPGPHPINSAKLLRSSNYFRPRARRGLGRFQKKCPKTSRENLGDPILTNLQSEGCTYCTVQAQVVHNKEPFSRGGGGNRLGTGSLVSYNAHTSRLSC